MPTQTNIVGRRMRVPLSLRHYIEERISRLARACDWIESVDFVLLKEKGKKAVEATATTSVGGKFVGKAEHAQTRAAVGLVCDKLRRQLIRQKQKATVDRVAGAERPWCKEETGEDDDELTYEQIVEET